MSLATIGSTSLLPYDIVSGQTAANFGLPVLPNKRFHRVKFGDIEINALHDGATRLPLNERYVTNAPFAEVKALAASLGLSTEYVELPFTGFLVVAGSRRILIDTGLGEFGSPRETTGRLVDSLRAAGHSPEDIDTVLISHFHADHISGLRNRAGAFVYSNAKVLVSFREYEYWMSDAQMRAAPERKTAFELARRVFTDMPDTMLRQFQPGEEVAPGIRSAAAYGHTPGHTIYEVKSGTQSFHYVADMINVPTFFARHPDWAVASDMDPAAARQVRHQFLTQVVANSDVRVGGFHFPFPAIGHLRPEQEGFRFEALG